MVWFRVDDNLAFHPKVIEAGNAAMGLWVRAGAWSAANLTDGFVPTRVALRIGSRSSVYKLLGSGLFVEENSRESSGELGFYFHDWSDKNFTKEQVEERRERERVKKVEQRKRRLEVVKPASDVPPGQTEGPRARVRPYPALSSNYGGVSAVGSNPPPEVGSADPPPQFCPEHPHGTSAPCRACQAARQQHDTSTTERNHKTYYGRRSAIDACPHCDQNGLRDIDNGVTRCNHNPATFEPGDSYPPEWTPLIRQRD